MLSTHLPINYSLIANKRTMSKVKKTIKLSEATFSIISEFLKSKCFHAEMPEANTRKIDSEMSFGFWKDQILSKFPDASINLTQGANWYEEVRVSDPFFEELSKSFKEFKANAITGYN